ncbi:MAG: hypothetical protein AUJ47_02870 [Candidatus Marinimicrobia bacterium CG1_02_48_14]|nr:MAG: hypothetical protein AUJ47_02870 [Candidatus Marinimicrobia bacterium CG1_02_48_14]
MSTFVYKLFDQDYLNSLLKASLFIGKYGVNFPMLRVGHFEIFLLDNHLIRIILCCVTFIGIVSKSVMTPCIVVVQYNHNHPEGK